MKKWGTILGLLALAVSIAAAIIAIAAYFKRRSQMFFDDFDDEYSDDNLIDLDYYATHVDNMHSYDDMSDQFEDSEDVMSASKQEPSDIDPVDDPVSE